MSCLTILRRHWICSIFVFSFFLFLSFFGLSQNSYATSVTCNQDIYPSETVSFNPICADTSSLDSSKEWFYFLETSVNTSAGSGTIWATNNQSLYGSGPSDFRVYYGGLSFLSSPYTFVWTSIPNFRTGFLHVNGNATPIRFYDAVLTVTDDISSSQPEPCPVCPEIPENPYDNKLDEIKKAIYACGAVILVLYFFFCIYKIIVKDGGSR